MECFFNIISFGSLYSFMFSSSVKYESIQVQNTIKNVEKFRADLGGTEIYSPLEKIFKTPRKKGYPRQIFLLTDGCVSNENSVIELVKANN